MNRRERLDYNPIINRPRLLLKNNKKIILWFLSNLELWDPTLPQLRMFLQLQLIFLIFPVLPICSWHNYGLKLV